MPYGGVDVRPHAVTYTRLTGDYCWVKVNGITFLNVYKEPLNSSAVEPLLEWNPPSQTIAAGDFNSVYWAWQTSARSFYGQGEEIERWADKHGLSCLILGEPTHRAGNTLDLVWSNISGASAWVDRDECMISDHFPISGIVPCYTRAINKPKGPFRVSKDKVPLFAHLVSQWTPNVQELTVTEEIEQFAQDLGRALTDALKAVGKASSGGSGRSAPWWTPECKAARLQYRSASVEADRNQYARAYRNTIAGAKREYWKSHIEDIKSLPDIYRLMRWTNPRDTKIPPPLLFNGRLVSKQAERAEILRDSLLARFEASDDLPNPTITTENRIPWTMELK
ncbi:hypothetical protein K3495_g371 [Podosphaera aphanis]|nr:hypothetical protein K3495_g371 [Podosphaera aphanis]